MAALTIGAVGTLGATREQRPPGPGTAGPHPRARATNSAPAAPPTPASALQVRDAIGAAGSAGSSSAATRSTVMRTTTPSWPPSCGYSARARLRRAASVQPIRHQRLLLRGPQTRTAGRRSVRRGGRADAPDRPALPVIRLPLYARKPLAMYHHGERTDRAFQDGQMATVREWCKQARDLGCLVGVGTHKPEVIAFVEEQGWDVDFFAGYVYNRTRTAGGRVEEGAERRVARDAVGESTCGDPRVYRVMRQTPKTCFASDHGRWPNRRQRRG